MVMVMAMRANLASAVLLASLLLVWSGSTARSPHRTPSPLGFFCNAQLRGAGQTAVLSRSSCRRAGLLLRTADTSLFARSGAQWRGACSALVLSAAAGGKARGAAGGNSSRVDGLTRKKGTAARSRTGVSSTRKCSTNSSAPSGSSAAHAAGRTASRPAGASNAGDSLTLTRSLWGGELGPIQALVIGKIIIDEFVLRRQPEGKVVRTGLGGGSPQAAIGARLWGSRTGLVAPVGQGFAQEILSPLEFAGVDTQGVSRLKGYVTPHTQIRYEAERMVWTPGEGWDRWMELGREMLPIPQGYQTADLLHIITEGAGGAEVDMADEFNNASVAQAAAREAAGEGASPLADAEDEASAARASKKGKSKLNTADGKRKTGKAAALGDVDLPLLETGDASKAPMLSMEPVIHAVTEGTVESLRRITEKATVVSPDWETALKISNMCSARGHSGEVGGRSVGGQYDGLEVSGCVLHPHLVGKYELRRGEKYWGGRPVYAMTRGSAGGVQSTYYIYHKTTPGCASRWFIGPQQGSAVACLYVESEAVSPDEIDGPWQEFNSTSECWIGVPDLKVSRGLPELTFKDTHAVPRRVYADRGRLLMEAGGALTRVRAVEFDPRHLRMVIEEDALPATRSRDAAMASKYTEDTEQTEDAGEEDDDSDGEVESREGDLDVDQEAVEALERALSLQAFAPEPAASKEDAPIQGPESGKLVEKDDGEVGAVNAAAAAAATDASGEPQGDGSEEEQGGKEGDGLEDALGSGTHELVLRDREAAVHLQMLCASLGVPFVLQGEQRVAWEEVESSLVVTQDVQDLWRAVVEDESGDIYYWNTVTDETSWERPSELLRVSTSRDTRQPVLRGVKGDVTRVQAAGDDAEAGRSGLGEEWEPSPQVVLERCAKMLGMTDGSGGILAVRRGSKGSYILDCRDMDCVWEIPRVPVEVTDPTGAGNAYSAALGYNLAQLLPQDPLPASSGADAPASGQSSSGDSPTRRDARRDAILASACRASATGAAFVKCEGMPVPSLALQAWMRDQAVRLQQDVRALPLRHEASEEREAAALTPPPAPVVAKRGRGCRGRGRGNVGRRDGKGKVAGKEEAAASASGTGTVSRGSRGRGRRGRGGRGSD